MLDRLRGSRSTLDADRLKMQAADVNARLSDASERAGQAAEALAHQARAAAHQARGWAVPRAEKAWQEGRKAAAPRIEAAAANAIPIVDRGHDKLVDEILPKLVAAITAAASAAAVGADKARDVADAKLTEIAHIAPPPKRRTGAMVFWSIAGLAVAGGFLAVLRRRQPASDPWAEEPWDEAEADLATRAADARATLDEMPPTTSDAAAEVVAERGLETAEAEAQAAAEDTTEKLGESSADARPRRSSTTRTGSRTKPAATGTGAAADVPPEAPTE